MSLPEAAWGPWGSLQHRGALIGNPHSPSTTESAKSERDALRESHYDTCQTPDWRFAEALTEAGEAGESLRREPPGGQVRCSSTLENVPRRDISRERLHLQTGRRHVLLLLF
jgi:hypothetical protein